MKMDSSVRARVASRYARQIRMILERGDYLRARIVVEEAISYFISQESELENVDIESLGIGGRAIAILNNCEIYKVSELIKLSPKELKNISNIGKKTINEIEKALAAHGLKLA